MDAMMVSLFHYVVLGYPNYLYEISLAYQAWCNSILVGVVFALSNMLDVYTSSDRYMIQYRTSDVFNV